MSNEPEPRSRAQRREEAEPSERSQPIPLIVAAITLAVVLAGVAYILLSESFGRADLGDRRTLADLRPAVARAGQGADGQQVFNANCVACHQASGKGLPGVFPPLDGSEWVNGDERILANIVLHGINGEISVIGQTYKGAMPAFGQLGNAELAAVLSHVRSAWSNKSAPVKAELIEKERKANARPTPFSSGDELKALAPKTP
ncbi:c-type cytochrome [Piscinibacter sp.]|jgi:mono/diheme cytochrome c family protein|uniref:c-type cytochrome n=1 Tax=Piscinibacter sp. TaxID=1903157 RepID=UPI00355A2697